MSEKIIEDILTQKITIAEIRVFKNYSTIEDNSFDSLVNLEELLNVDDKGSVKLDTLPFSEVNLQSFTKKIEDYKVLNLLRKGEKGSQKYFYNVERKTEPTCVLNSCKLNGTQYFHILDTDDHFLEHYKKPFTEIKINSFYRRIRKNGTKYTFIYYMKHRVRHVNQKYFIQKTFQKSLTIDFKTGNFYCGDISNGVRKIHCNSFTELRGFLSNFMVNDKEKFFFQKNKRFQSEITNRKILDKIGEVFNDNEYNLKVREVLGQEIMFNDVEPTMKFICDNFIGNNTIKVPNDYYHYLLNYYPTKKYLKSSKTSNSLIKGILTKFNLNSKYFNKLLNNIPNINLQLLKNFCFNILNHDFGKQLSMLNEETIKHFFTEHGYYPNFVIIDESVEYRTNILKLMNEFVEVEKKKDISQQLNFDFNLLNDHISFLNRINSYGLNYEFNAQNLKSFHEEHSKFTDLIDLISTGVDIKKVYHEKFLNTIEVPITIMTKDFETITFNPVILKTKQEYKDEGKHMNHCVSGYIDRKNLIISIRMEDGKDRVTMEYSYLGTQHQAKHFSNQTPPEHFDEVINIINEKIRGLSIRNLHDYNYLEPIEIIETPLIIDNVKIEKKNPIWTPINLEMQPIDDILF